MTDPLRQLVRERAEFRCEYCLMPERLVAFHRFEPDHIRPRKFGGLTDPENLAWCCLSCNRHKGALLAGPDPDTSELVRFFNPRIDDWQEHFVYEPPRIVGSTPIGKVTVWALAMNSEEYVDLREALGELFKP